MKFINPLSILVAAALTLTLVSCTTSQYASDENYERERPTGNRIYLDDPYRGTIVLERDPYTGRYYDVTPGYGAYANRNYSPYGYNPYRNNVYYRNNDRVNNTQVTQQNTEDRNKAREEARKKVLGN